MQQKYEKQKQTVHAGYFNNMTIQWTSLYGRAQYWHKNIT